MARDRGRASQHRTRKAREALRVRDVYIFAEGEVTEEKYVDLVMRHGAPADVQRRVKQHISSATYATKDRKPLRLVQRAIATLLEKESDAKRAGLDPKAWAWPQVWCLFDRDDHPDIPSAFAQARKAGKGGVRIAFSHPCFELWRLLHYQDYTGSFGGVCEAANTRLRRQPGFAATYGPTFTRVAVDLSKHVKPDQLLGRYEQAKARAQRLNARHPDGDPTQWDPYTDVWRLVEEGLGLARY